MATIASWWPIRYRPRARSRPPTTTKDRRVSSNTDRSSLSTSGPNSIFISVPQRGPRPGPSPIPPPAATAQKVSFSGKTSESPWSDHDPGVDGSSLVGTPERQAVSQRSQNEEFIILRLGDDHPGALRPDRSLGEESEPDHADHLARWSPTECDPGDGRRQASCMSRSTGLGYSEESAIG